MPGLSLSSGPAYPAGAFIQGVSAMRLPTIPPDQLSAEQRPFYEDMRAEIEKDF